jgi:hypothetical protein
MAERGAGMVAGTGRRAGAPWFSHRDLAIEMGTDGVMSHTIHRLTSELGCVQFVVGPDDHGGDADPANVFDMDPEHGPQLRIRYYDRGGVRTRGGPEAGPGGGAASRAIDSPALVAALTASEQPERGSPDSILTMRRGGGGGT